MKNFMVTFSLACVLGACASTPDPAEICSAEWIAPRAERAMSDFEKDTKSIFKKLKSAGESYAKGNKPGPFQMMSLMSSLNRLGDKFENGRAVRDMKTLASTCNDPDFLKTSMTNFMREQGLEEQLINFINGLKPYQDMLRSQLETRGS